MPYKWDKNTVKAEFQLNIEDMVNRTSSWHKWLVVPVDKVQETVYMAAANYVNDSYLYGYMEAQGNLSNTLAQAMAHVQITPRKPLGRDDFVEAYFGFENIVNHLNTDILRPGYHTKGYERQDAIDVANYIVSNAMWPAYVKGYTNALRI